jgi:orotidine-5'-phosphate decarboxylase
MVEAAVEGAARGAAVAGVEPPAVVGVTVLTSIDDEMLAALGVERPAAEQVPLLARVARSGGAAGVVCSPREAGEMRALLGGSALVVTPGVRLHLSEAGDQARIATPTDALRAGASHLVVGRPITEAPVAAKAAGQILAEMEEALTWRTT